MKNLLTMEQTEDLIYTWGVPKEYVTGVNDKGENVFSQDDLFAILEFTNTPFTVSFCENKCYRGCFDGVGFYERDRLLVNVLYKLVLYTCRVWSTFKERRIQNEEWSELTVKEKSNITRVYYHYMYDDVDEKLASILSDKFGLHNIEEFHILN